MGFSVIPLGSVGEVPPDYFVRDRCNNDLGEAMQRWPKTPRYRWKEYQTRYSTEEEIGHWWTLNPASNIAIVTGIDVFVVDADSEAAIDWVEAKNISVTPWRVNTGKGRHYYYLMAPGIKLRNTASVIKKIDTRGTGGYVVAAGSTHPNGHGYTWNNLPGWHCDMICDLPEITLADIEALERYNGQPVNPSGKKSYGDMRGLHLAHDGSQVVHGERNTAATSMAGSFLQQGMSIVETAGLIREWDNRNPEPMGEGEVNTIVASVASTALSNGNEVMVAPAQPDNQKIPKPVVDPTTGENFVPEQTQGAMEAHAAQMAKLVRPLGDLLSTPPPAIENFWHEDVIYRGSRMIIGGDAKIGKSRFALAMAASAACGKKFLDWPFHKPLRTLWAQAEIDDGHLWGRAEIVRQGLLKSERELIDRNLFVSSEMEFNLFEDFDHYALTRILEEVKPDILMIDPIVNFVAMNENDAAEVTKFLRLFDRIKREHRCAVVLVHHNKKRAARAAASIDDLRGSTAFRGWADAAIILAGTPTKTQLIWDLRHTVLPCGEVKWDNTQGTYTFSIPMEETETLEPGKLERIEQVKHLIDAELLRAPLTDANELRQTVHAKNPEIATAGLVRDVVASLRSDPGYIFDAGGERIKIGLAKKEVVISDT